MLFGRGVGFWVRRRHATLQRRFIGLYACTFFYGFLRSYAMLFSCHFIPVGRHRGTQYESGAAKLGSPPREYACFVLEELQSFKALGCSGYISPTLYSRAKRWLISEEFCVPAQVNITSQKI